MRSGVWPSAAANPPDRLAERKPALVQCASDDAPRNGERSQSLQVEKLADSARSDHRGLQGPGQSSDRLEVRAFEHAVTCDVGEDDPRERQRLELSWRKSGPGCSRRRPMPRWRPFRPARPAPGSSARDRARPSGRTNPGRGGLACPRPQRSSPAESHAAIVASSRSPPPSWHGTPDSANDLRDCLDVDRTARLGTVEIDQVDSLGTLGFPACSHRRRIITEDRFLIEISLPKPDATSSSQVDRRDHLHHVHRRP